MVATDYLTIMLVVTVIIAVMTPITLSFMQRQRHLMEITNEMLWKRARTELDLMAARLDIQNLRLESVESQLEEFKRGTRILINQLLDVEVEPKWSFPDTQPATVKPKRDPLLQILGERFTVEELATLAYDIGLNPENVGGETVTGVALRLLEAARRNSVESQLVELVRRARPNAFEN